MIADDVTQLRAQAILMEIRPTIVTIVRDWLAANVARPVARPVAVASHQPHFGDGEAVLPAEPVVTLELPRRTQRHSCGICGAPGHNARRCAQRGERVLEAARPIAAIPARELNAEDAADLRALAPRRLQPTPAARELAERRAIAREANPINPRGSLPTPHSTWMF